MEEKKQIKGFKGFNSKLQCTPSGKVFQYEVGKTYEEDSAELCSSGFHFCENPLSVLNYYPLKDGNRYAEIIGEDVSENTEDDTKRCCKKITIKSELSICNLIKLAVEWTKEKASNKGVKNTSGGYAHSATSGKYAHSATSGGYAHSATSGDYAHSATSGYYAHSATSGDYAHSATSGNYAHSATSGDYAHSATSGDYANSATSGKYAHSATSGKYSRSSVKDTAIAASIGVNGKAKGEIGCWIVLAEWKYNNNDELEIKCVKSAIVDGETIKSDTYYFLENGEFIEYVD